MGLSLSNQCAMLGYDLHYWQTDVWGVKHRYCTSNARVSFSDDDGIISGGAILYHDNAKELQSWIDNVNFIRECYSDDGTMTLLSAYQVKYDYTPRHKRLVP